MNEARRGFNVRATSEKGNHTIIAVSIEGRDAEFEKTDYDIDLRSEGVYITTRQTGNGVFYPIHLIKYIKYNYKEPGSNFSF